MRCVGLCKCTPFQLTERYHSLTCFQRLSLSPQEIKYSSSPLCFFSCGWLCGSRDAGNKPICRRPTLRAAARRLAQRCGTPKHRSPFHICTLYASLPLLTTKGLTSTLDVRQLQESRGNGIPVSFDPFDGVPSYEKDLHVTAPAVFRSCLESRNDLRGTICAESSP